MPEKGQLNVYLSPEHWAILEALRRLRGAQSRTSFVREAVLDAIRREAAQEEDAERLAELAAEILRVEFGRVPTQDLVSEIQGRWRRADVPPPSPPGRSAPGGE